MSARFPDKATARQHVWDRLEREGAARPPLPAYGRIPNFDGADTAARRLFTLAPWRDAGRIKVNPDTAQFHVRLEALRRGIEVYVATPRLAAGFRRIDPARIPAERLAEAADRRTWDAWSAEVDLGALPQMDAIVCGSVAVGPDGGRAGKGAGYSDLEFAILMELGQRPVPVATTVHDLQVVEAFPTEDIDQRLSAIVTPTRAMEVSATAVQPAGIDWQRLTEADIAAMPVVAALRERPSGGVPSRRRPDRPSTSPMPPGRR